MFDRFSLVLVLTHACNLRCRYCYTGAKLGRSMPQRVGAKAIDRAVASLAPRGILDLGFFGGEPMLEAPRMAALIAHAERRVAECGAQLRLGVTTNGTAAHDDAWRIMLRNDMDLVISHDGLPRAHDRHRLTIAGDETCAQVERTMARLQRAGKAFRVNMVVRPDTAADMPAGVEHLLNLGVHRIDLSLDLWCDWDERAARALEASIEQVAALWHAHLPGVGINWFDEKAARLARVPMADNPRCGFGRGEIAVSPAGRLYPCERLVGEDRDDNPMRLPCSLFDGDAFLNMPRFNPRGHEACDDCAIAEACSTTCRCSNYVRTGDVATPDRLLCLFNEATTRQTLRYMQPACEARGATISSVHHEEVLR